LSARKFEESTANLLKAMGFVDVKRVGRIADRGVDVEAYNEDEFGHRWKYIVQCKFFDEGLVSSPDLQKFVGALSIHNADRGIFVTSSSFTKEAQDIANDNSITLIDGSMFKELCERHQLSDIPKKRGRKKKPKQLRTKTFQDLFDSLSFGKGQNKEFIIPNVDPMAFLKGFTISLKNASDIKLDEIEITDARILTRGFFVVDWKVDKVWHDSQGFPRRTWSGKGTFVTDETRNVVYDVGRGRRNVKRSPIGKFLDDQPPKNYRVLTRKFDVIFPNIKRVAYKKLITLNGIPSQDIYCVPRKCYIATKLILEYIYKQKKCSFIMNCVKSDFENNIPIFSRQEAQFIAVKEYPELETEKLDVTDGGNKWIVTFPNSNHELLIHKNSGNILRENTSAEKIVEKAYQEAKKIFPDATYNENVFLNIKIGKQCKSSWELTFTSENGSIKVVSNLKGKMTFKKLINDKHALELAQKENTAKSELLKMTKNKEGYIFHFSDEKFYWKLRVDYEGNTKIISSSLTWNEAVKRATDHLVKRNIDSPVLTSETGESIQDKYQLQFESNLDGKYWVTIAHTPVTDTCRITKQAITEHRARYLAKKKSHGDLVSFSNRFFGLGDGWNAVITDKDGEKKKIRIKKNGKLILNK